jgi:hypothetical protein
MTRNKWIAALAILSISKSVSAGQSGPVSLSHFEPLQRFSMESRAVDGSRKLTGAGPVDMKFDALGRSFELELTPNANLQAAPGGNEVGGGVPYRGRIAGNPESWVRITVIDGTPTGLIWDGTEMLAIERPGNNVAESGSTIIYRLADAVVASGAMACGGGTPITNGGTVYKALVSELNVSKEQALGAVSELNMGAIGDFEFFGRHGNASHDEIVARLNNVDGIFSQEVGIQINVPVVEVFSDANDPFSNELNASLLLDELATYRRNNATQNANGLTHLWTGKNVQSNSGSASTVGIAFTGGLCNQRFGAALSEGRSSQAFDSLIAAHEIGHNFGAPHDAVPGPCENTQPNFLMATTLNNSDRFSQCSKDEMADDIVQAEIDGCITPLPSVDMRINLVGTDPTILLGNAANVTFDVANGGTVQATNVTADFTLPTNISLISAAASIGSCNAGAGSVSCVIGAVDGASMVTVALTADTTGIGAGTIDASVGADVDDNLSNNTASALLTVQPAVNLGVTAPAARRIDVNASTSLSLTLENSSVLDATAVTLDISVSSGLQANSASWSAGTCMVAGTRIDCQAATLDAQSTSTLTINVTGTSAGTRTVSVSMSSLEADADPSNNSASATINVGSAAEESSGGGSMGYLVLLMLAFAGMRGYAQLERRKLVP